MTPESKSKPLDVRLEIVNKKDWKSAKSLLVKVNGQFRNSGWRVKEHSYQVKGDIIEMDIKAKHLGGLSAMVLTPFEVAEKIQLVDTKINYKIRVFIDGDEYATDHL